MTIYTLLNRKPDGEGNAYSCTSLKELVDFNRNLNYKILQHHFKKEGKTW